jgi:hypothetical protein
MFAIMKTPTSLPSRLPRSVPAAALLLAFTSLGFASSIVELSQSYVPAGENYSITALQNLTPLTFYGGTTVGANPNVNLEFPGGFGVRYENASGQLTDFGIGLYAAGGPTNFHTATTGLDVTFAHLVSSQGLSATLGGFDIQNLSNGFDTGKVAPTITIYGTLGLAEQFSAADILANHALTLLSSNDPIANTDLWKLDLGALVGPDHQISAFALGADTHNGSGSLMTATSDPYFLVSVNSCDCTMIPEPGSAFLILSAGLSALIITRRRSRGLWSSR